MNRPKKSFEIFGNNLQKARNPREKFGSRSPVQTGESTYRNILSRGAKRNGGGGPCEAWWRGLRSIRINLNRRRPPPPRRRSVPLPRFAGEEWALSRSAPV